MCLGETAFADVIEWHEGFQSDVRPGALAASGHGNAVSFHVDPLPSRTFPDVRRVSIHCMPDPP